MVATIAMAKAVAQTMVATIAHGQTQLFCSFSLKSKKINKKKVGHERAKWTRTTIETKDRAKRAASQLVPQAKGW